MVRQSRQGRRPRRQVNLELIDGLVPDHQKAGCWLVVSKIVAYLATAT